MGHAGAIVLGDKGTFAAKRDALEAAGATVVATPTEVGPALKVALG
jgi:succinyl-CoA synthetase alpha subunit